MVDETIAAIVTPLGEGGIAVLRLSGTESIPIADQLFRGKSPLAAAVSHTVHYGWIVDGDQRVDEVLVTVLRAPRTFTREDVVEISCHGGVLLAKTILDLLLQHGARLSLPGEFTRRAFLNGRIDLTQAEAVADLIQARTDLAIQAANEQLAGHLCRRIETLREGMMSTLAHVEAHIDFPDEDIAPDTRAALVQRLEQAMAFMDELLRTAPEGQILRRGLRVAIVGRPNAGKSSLLNRLLGHERAIVSPLPGTTRDTIEETANIRGIPVVFVDTAGLRESQDSIELEGMRRSQETLERADLILHVLDGSQSLLIEDEKYLAQLVDRKHLLILNKSDLGRALALPSTLGSVGIPVSCHTGEGVEALKDAIRNLVWSGGVGAEPHRVMINSRHQNALLRAQEGTTRAVEALRKEASLELVALDLRSAVHAVGEVVGRTTTEDLLDSIFSQFCIGK